MRIGARDVLWMAVGAALLLVLSTVIVRFYGEREGATPLAFKARRIALVARMRTSLASAAEAEKSAVLATTDEESRAFAERARALDGDVERVREELSAVAEAAGVTQEERDALAQFSQAFAELRRIDDDILDLAVKNTNLKASALTFGSATEAVNAMRAALAPLAENGGEDATTIAPERARAARLAARAEIGALHVLTMLPPHIAADSDEKMTAMEAAMATEEQRVGAALADLAALPSVTDRSELANAQVAWARFGELKAQILALSRENTNVRSLDISLNRKRTVLTLCENALARLQQTIETQQIGTSGRWALPR